MRWRVVPLLAPRGQCGLRYLHVLGPEELMRAGVPQADLSVIATAQEVRLPGVNCQTPQLICVTLQRGTKSNQFIKEFFIL